MTEIHKCRVYCSNTGLDCVLLSYTLPLTCIAVLHADPSRADPWTRERAPDQYEYRCDARPLGGIGGVRPRCCQDGRLSHVLVEGLADSADGEAGGYEPCADA